MCDSASGGERNLHGCQKAVSLRTELIARNVYVSSTTSPQVPTLREQGGKTVQSQVSCAQCAP